MSESNEIRIVARMQSLVSEINSLDNAERKTVIDHVEEVLKEMKYRNGDTIAGFVYQTMDLTQFVDLQANRIINEDSTALRELADSIVANGNLSPISINDKNELIDGQRRLRANRRYGIGLPMLYFRRKGYDINAVSEMNKTNLKWSHKDWLHRFVTEKRPDYVDYVHIAKKYEQYMRSRSLRSLLMYNRVESFPSRIWEGGLFKIDRQTLDLNLKFLEFLKSVFEIGGIQNIFAKDRNFQKALYDVYSKAKNLEEDRLLYKIQYGFKRLNIKADYKTYKQIMGTLYNSRLRSDLPHVVLHEHGEELPLIEDGEVVSVEEQKTEDAPAPKTKPKQKSKQKDKEKVKV